MSEEKNKHLRQLVKRWIRIEFQFRLGTYGHINAMDCQKELVKVEEDLREAITGRRILVDAGQRLGLDIEEKRFPKKRAKKKSKKADNKGVKITAGKRKDA